MNKDYTADILFADLDGKTLWVDFNNHIGSGIYVNNGKAHIRTVGAFINDADKMAMTEKNKKVFCNCTCAEIYISNVPSNAAMFCVYGVCYEAHLRSDVASTVSNFVGGYDYVAVGDLTLSKTS